MDRGAARLREGSSMTYSLIQLAPGAYDLLLNGEVMEAS
jgi:hypothetical protein